MILTIMLEKARILLANGKALILDSSVSNYVKYGPFPYVIKSMVFYRHKRYKLNFINGMKINEVMTMDDCFQGQSQNDTTKILSIER